MRVCNKISGLLRDRVIIRDPITAKLTWPNGSHIYKSFDETWLQAVTNTKQSSLVMIGDRHEEAGTVYNYLGVKREDEDADSEDQAELGWISGEVVHHHANSAERVDRVSKEV